MKFSANVGQISGISQLKISIYIHTRNKISNWSDISTIILFDWFSNPLKYKINAALTDSVCVHVHTCIIVYIYLIYVCVF